MREPALLELSNVVKDYHALRPLRVEHLAVHRGERLAVGGFDAVAAEVLVNLITGAALPDSGTITLFGRDTASIADSAEWLTLVDRFGIVSGRTVLLESLTLAQNLALPFSLDIEPLEGELRSRALDAGREVGLSQELADQTASMLGARDRYRLRLARALALNPEVMILEHPTAELPGTDAEAAGRDTRAITERRQVAGLALTADATFARGFAGSLHRWNGANGRIAEEGGWWSRLRAAP